MTSAENFLYAKLAARAVLTPDDLFGEDDAGRQRTWAQVHQDALGLAAALAEQGLGRGSTVAWQLPNRLDAATLVFALNRLGCLQVPLLPILGDREMKFALRQTGAEMLVSAGKWRHHDFQTRARALVDEMSGEGQQIRQFIVDGDLPVGDLSRLDDVPGSSPEDIRWCFYTSGSTGDPKGVLHTDLSVYASAVGMADRWQLTSQDRGVFNFPMTHVGGFGWLYAAVLKGFAMLFLEAFDPATSIPRMRAFHVTHAGAGPPFFLSYVEAQRQHGSQERVLPSVRVFGGGGSPKTPTLHATMKSVLGLGVSSTYGMTESPMTVMTDLDAPDEVLAHSEGRPVVGAQVRIVGMDGATASVGEEGEIQIRSGQLFAGYLDSALNEAAFTEDGWFRTGDLGRVDAHDNVTVTGRLKDVIIRNMENVSAQEVENLLIQREDVAEVAVIGVPDERTGERVCAVVVLAPGAEPFSVSELFDWCVEQGLMKQKAPERLEFVEDLPRHPMGKVVKAELRRAYAD